MYFRVMPIRRQTENKAARRNYRVIIGGTIRRQRFDGRIFGGKPRGWRSTRALLPPVRSVYSRPLHVTIFFPDQRYMAAGGRAEKGGKRETGGITSSL